MSKNLQRAMGRKNNSSRISSSGQHQVVPNPKQEDGSFINYICQTIRDNKNWESTLIGNRVNLRLNPFHVVQVMLNVSKSPPKALGFFTWAGEQVGHTPTTYSTIIHILTRAKMLKKAEKLMHEFISFTEKNQYMVKKSGVYATHVKVFNALKVPDFSLVILCLLMIAFAETGRVQEAIEVVLLFYRFQESEKQMPISFVAACSIVLSTLVKMDRVDTVWVLYRGMRGRGLYPDVFIYNTLIHACCKQGTLRKAFELFDEMRDNGILPTVVTYTILICGLSKSDKMQEANDLFMTMQNLGVFPNLFTYNAMMDGYCKRGDVEIALRFFEDMLRRGMECNVVTYCTLIDGFCKDRRIEEAKKVFFQMLERGGEANVVTYNSLIDGNCKEGDLEGASRLHFQMLEMGFVPDVFTYTALIKGFCMVRRTEEAEKILYEMDEKGVVPNCITYNTVIDGFCKEEKLDKALALCSQMVENGLMPNVVTYSTLIDGYCKVDKMD